MCVITKKPLFTCGLGFYLIAFKSFSPGLVLRDPLVLSVEERSQESFSSTIRFKPGQNVIDKYSGDVFAFDETRRGFLWQGVTGIKHQRKENAADGFFERTKNSGFSWLFKGVKKSLKVPSGIFWTVPDLPDKQLTLLRQISEENPLPVSLAVSRESIEVLGLHENAIAVRFAPDIREKETIQLFNNFTNHFFEAMQLSREDEIGRSIVQFVRKRDKIRQKAIQDGVVSGLNSPKTGSAFKNFRFNSKTRDPSSPTRSKGRGDTSATHAQEATCYSMMAPKQAVETIKKKLSAIAKKETAENALKWLDPDRKFREDNEKMQRKLNFKKRTQASSPKADNPAIPMEGKHASFKADHF